MEWAISIKGSSMPFLLARSAASSSGVGGISGVVFTDHNTDAMEQKDLTNLYVLVQERSNAAVAPVSELVGKLSREGRFAFLSIIAMIAALWFFVFRVFRLPEQSSLASRIRSNTEHASTAANEATIDISN